MQDVAIPVTRGRVLFFYLAVSLAISIAAAALVWPSWRAQVPRPPLPEAVTPFVWYCVLLAFLMRPVTHSGGSLGEILGRFPDRRALLRSVAVAVGLVGVALACIGAMFVPLSYVAPSFVEWWLFEDPLTMIWTHGDHHQIANIINGLTFTLIGPFVEELFFRGLLLPAWAARIGMKWAVIWSSLIFGMLHPDILGGFIFGVVTSLVYLETRSLWLPIAIHVATNASAWLVEAGALTFFGRSRQTLSEFQATWWIGVAGLIVGVPLLIAAERSLRRAVAGRPALSE